MSPAIEVNGLWKEYIIGGQENRPDSFREMLTGAMSAPFKRILRRGAETPPEHFWALKDINFSVQPGEVVGIIGKNGAGKSTLLKILSRITEPTKGDVRIRGRVASLLEVGTGFHPELTGRENVYLNGAILGMSRAEIACKFDEIVAFAEIDKFLDTPVKRYSSGMYVRLAFSVAAHLDCDVLLVDEVLAVGDVSFQKKCLACMQDISKVGRTVVFVSHNLDSLRRLCGRGILLQSGALTFEGPIEVATGLYLGRDNVSATEGTHVIEMPRLPGSEFYARKLEILDAGGHPLPAPKTWDDVTFRVELYSPRATSAGSVVIQIGTLSGTVLHLFSTQPDSSFVCDLKAGVNKVDCRVPRLSLSAGDYSIGVGLAIPNVEWLYQSLDSGVLRVFEKDVLNAGMAPTSNRYLVPVEHQWSLA